MPFPVVRPTAPTNNLLNIAELYLRGRALKQREEAVQATNKRNEIIDARAQASLDERIRHNQATESRLTASDAATAAKTAADAAKDTARTDALINIYENKFGPLSEEQKGNFRKGGHQAVADAIANEFKSKQEKRLQAKQDAPAKDKETTAADRKVAKNRVELDSVLSSFDEDERAVIADEVATLYRKFKNEGNEDSEAMTLAIEEFKKTKTKPGDPGIRFVPFTGEDPSLHLEGVDGVVDVPEVTVTPTQKRSGTIGGRSIGKFKNIQVIE